MEEEEQACAVGRQERAMGARGKSKKGTWPHCEKPKASCTCMEGPLRIQEDTIFVQVKR